MTATIGSRSGLPQLGDWRDPEELRRLQDAQLAQLLSWAARSPYYTKLLGGAPMPEDRAGFQQLPLTTKDDLRAGYPFGLLAVPKRRLATYHESSGTAGTPTASYYTEEDWVDLAERYARKVVPIGPEDVFLVRTPYALMITGHLAQAAARMRGATVVPGDNRSLAMPYSRVVRVLHDLGVSLTWSMATETMIWAAGAELAGYRPGTDFPALRALYVGGEPVTPVRKARISQTWGVPVVEEYGSTETGSLAGECPAGQLHFWADRAIAEVYDPATGAVTEEGDGELVVTPLYREAMPLLRYNLGDFVELRRGGCSCDWQLPVIRVLGRSAFGYPVSGIRVMQHRLEELVFSLPAEYGVWFWRARAEPDRLRVDIEVRPEHAAAACADLVASIRGELGASSEVSPVPPGTLVPTQMLTAIHDVVKPRSLFGPDEDWSKSLLYY